MDEPGGGERRFSATPPVRQRERQRRLRGEHLLPARWARSSTCASRWRRAPSRCRPAPKSSARSAPTARSGRTGFGIRFVEFSGQTEVSLARLFLGMKLRAFAEEYMQSRRARSLPNELERVVDVLAAWELLKATTPGDPWRGE